MSIMVPLDATVANTTRVGPMIEEATMIRFIRCAGLPILPITSNPILSSIFHVEFLKLENFMPPFYG
jgi:hypothetical protein